MCTNELECLQRVASNTTTIKAFCYALSVVIATGVFMWAINKLITPFLSSNRW